MPSPVELIPLLRGCLLFSDLTDDELAMVAPLCEVEDADSGAKIFTEGEPADKVFIVVSGRVALEMRVQFGVSKSLRMATVEVVAPGELCGWSALVEPHVYTMSGVCLEPVRLVAIAAASLRDLLERCPMGLAVMKRLAMLIAARARGARHTLLHALAILSHDLKAPLAAIESYNQVILGGFAGPINQEQAEMLERNSVRVKEMLTLISDLLDISRIEAGTLLREFERANLGDVARECLAVAQALGDAKGVLVVSELPVAVPDIVAAPVRLRQAITNLLSNAIKFTPAKGTVTLRVSDGADQQRVEVTDTGTGISEHDLPRIFDDFYAGVNSDQKGQGLGLSIAKKIVTGHEGRIWVESPYPPESGHGSRFTFVIPKGLKVFRAG